MGCKTRADPRNGRGGRRRGRSMRSGMQKDGYRTAVGAWLPEIVGHLLKSREKHLVFGIGICPGNRLVLKYIPDHVTRLLAIGGVVKTGDPFRGKICRRFERKAVAINFDRRRRAPDVHGGQVLLER